MSDWPETTIGNVAEVKGGKRLPLGTALTGSKTNHPYLRIVDFIPGGINDAALMYVPNDVFPAIKRYTINHGDLFISIVGTVGVVGSIPTHLNGASLTENAAKIVLSNDRYDSDFLKYFLLSSEGQRRIDAMSVGSTQKKLALFRIKDIAIPFPPLSEQREIAATLGALDDKIQLNRKTAATLEEMARALYRSWFVDFDPVRARAEGHAPAHMDDATAALFPDSFGEDGLPLGWGVGTLADLVEFNPRERLLKGQPAPYFDMKALPTTGMITDTPITREFSSGTKFRSGDTLLARITPCLENGKTAMISGLADDIVAWGSTEFIVMRSRPSVSRAYPYCVARDSAFREAAIATMTGSSGRQRADAEAISALYAVVPTEEVLRAFERLAEPLIDRIHSTGDQSRTLATLRDALLPRLMSGELRVGAAREMIEEVA